MVTPSIVNESKLSRMRLAVVTVLHAERVIEMESLAGHWRAVSRFPQYFKKAILLGAKAVKIFELGSNVGIIN
jgi:hypothetical protein